MTSTGEVLQLKRVLPVSRERVFAAWIDPKKLKLWWGPGEVECLDAEVDLRVGGRYKILLKGESNQPFSVSGEYKEISEPQKLVFTWDWDDAEMSVGETLVTLKLSEVDGQTELELTHERFPTQNDRDNHEGGWTSLLEKLANSVS